MAKVSPKKRMPTRSRNTAAAPRRKSAKNAAPANDLRGMLWRLDRLERQVKTLSELVRDHAEDADRLVRIVGEDHEALRRELVREHQASIMLRRKRL